MDNKEMIGKRAEGQKKEKPAFRNSIQTRLVSVMAAMLIIVLVINLFIYNQINSMVARIDSTFASNVSIGELTDTLDLVQTNVYEYLNTRSSEALENYYRYAEEYRQLVQTLAGRAPNSRMAFLQSNIRGMSESYLDTADRTVQAKRGRNIERYKSSYEEETMLCQYIHDYAYELNSLRLETNSNNYQFLLSSLNTMERLSLGTLLLVAAVTLAGITLIVRSMIRPLRDLSETAREVAEGNFQVEVKKSGTRDEIGIVTETFDQMLESLKAYIEQIRTNVENEARMKERELSMEAHLKEAQLKFLQAQINPHFLFNSLNAGAQLALMEDAESTSVFLEKMADFFRYNVKKTNGDATLAEEIELVDNYIYILNVRFAGDITYVKEIAPGIGSEAVPAMILQPLVENAVTHGIHDMIDRGVISLTVEKEDGQIRVTVTDNGAGMSHEQIERILSGSKGKQEEGMSTGVGLPNVISRLQLYYNRGDLLSIYSEGMGLGTQITLLLPERQEG